MREEIKNDIHLNAWNPKIKAFTQSYGSDFLDASVLLMESYGFIDCKDPKYIDTVKAIERELLLMVYYFDTKIMMILVNQSPHLLFVLFGT